MEISPFTQQLLQRVEAVTGTPVEVITDGSLQVLAKVTMARPGARWHVLRVRPGRPIPDYLVVYECGFLLRLYANPPAERFEFASDEAGRAAVLQLLTAPGGLARQLRLDAPAVGQYATLLYDGLMTQLRSLPIGMRIDHWIYETYPSLREAQASAINEQQRTNAQVLAPKTREAAPAMIYAANLVMNAAYALFCDELYGEGGYSVAYRTAGFATRGQNLLDQWCGIAAEPTRDRELVDAWANALGLANWYRWVPLSVGSSA